MSGQDGALLPALQAIVGDRCARADRATLSNYAWNYGVGAQPGPRFLKQWPIAAVLPQSTEEVAAVVRFCVSRGLHYRAHSTGNGAFYLSHSPDTVVIDLCRMDRIVKIDTANQMAVIEPYVTAGRLQAEAMKVGLNCHIVGAGPGHSPLASATSFVGVGLTGSTTGTNLRNLLALEWVSPEGDIVRIGTDGDDWFSEEGPGPGFRGMVRGFAGANGALGIFTRIGYKLYPWAGKPQLTITGCHPQLGIELEEHMRFFMAAWPSAEAMRDASFRLNRARVVLAMLRMPTSNIGWVLSASNTEYGLRGERGELPEYTNLEPRFVWQILTHGVSARQAGFQQAVVRKVVEETGGWFLDVAPADAQVLARNILNSAYVGRVSRVSMRSATAFGVFESFNCLPDVYRAAEQIIASERRPGGSMASDSKEGHWTWPTEGRQLWTEALITAEPLEGRGAASALVTFLRTLHMTSRTARLGTNAFIMGLLAELFGPRLQSANTWMRRIKDTLDPRWVSDATMYLPRRRTGWMKAFLYLQPLLFSRLGRAVLESQLRLALRRFARLEQKHRGRG